MTDTSQRYITANTGFALILAVAPMLAPQVMPTVLLSLGVTPKKFAKAIAIVGVK